MAVSSHGRLGSSALLRVCAIASLNCVGVCNELNDSERSGLVDVEVATNESDKARMGDGGAHVACHVAAPTCSSR